MSKWWIVLCLLLSGAASAATVWTWVDANGQRHYSDRPVEGAETIELGGVQGFAPPPVPSVRSPAATDRETPQPYAVLRVAQPAENETLWNLEGTLEVSIEIEPGLRAGHAIDVELDGERRHLASRATRFTVSEVWRGVHTIQAIVLDSGGREIMRSPPRTFVVQQTSLLNPNNPNTSPPGAN